MMLSASIGLFGAAHLNDTASSRNKLTDAYAILVINAPYRPLQRPEAPCFGPKVKRVDQISVRIEISDEYVPLQRINDGYHQYGRPHDDIR